MSANSWQPSARPELLRARARLLSRIRDFFAGAGVLEVETPIASRFAATDPTIHSLKTGWMGVGPTAQRLYLNTSPEFGMKRLVAAGSGPIFQICKVFRDAERGRLHHPEFTLLEWYRPGTGYQALMREVADLARCALNRPQLEAEYLSYCELFKDRLGLDPMSASLEELRRAARDIPGAADLNLSRDGWLDLLLSYRIESALGRARLTFVFDYPPTQAALARVRDATVPVAERFELYLEGMELANGYQELTDATEQRRRFAEDLAVRDSCRLEQVEMDEELLRALEAGMPETAGVALGLDRLLMVATGSSHIDEVLAFPVERA